MDMRARWLLRSGGIIIVVRRPSSFGFVSSEPYIHPSIAHQLIRT